MHEHVNDFRRRGVQILAVVGHGTEGVREMLRLRGLEPGKVGFPILADPALTTGATYGVALQVNWWDDKWSNRPATFVIDRDGLLRYAYRAGRGQFSFTGRLMDKVHVAEDRPTAEDLLKILDDVRNAR